MSLAAIGFDSFFDFRQQIILHLDRMAAVWKTALVDVGNVFLKRSDAFLLQSAVFGGEVPIGFGMPRGAFVIVAQDII